MFSSTVEFSGPADRMALFRVGPNSIGVWEKTMRDEYLDWSQSKVFLVLVYYTVQLYRLYGGRRKLSVSFSAPSVWNSLSYS